MERIPLADKWPVALFENLVIHNKFRKRGLGRKGVKQFIQDARERGAVCCILQVAWGSDNTEHMEHERDWKTKFYASEGFIELEDPSPYAPVLMYLQLKTT
jgi:GNAT superfamily N-acetyltransferase